jgi:hypothetical protein
LPYIYELFQVLIYAFHQSYDEYNTITIMSANV